MTFLPDLEVQILPYRKINLKNAELIGRIFDVRKKQGSFNNPLSIIFDIQLTAISFQKTD